MSHIKKLSPLVGESVSGADERGKLEQKRKTDYFLCTQACPYRLAGSALPSEFGEADTKEKNYIFYYFYIRIFLYPMPDSSLPLTTYFFFYHYSDSDSRSRMTAEVNCISV